MPQPPQRPGSPRTGAGAPVEPESGKEKLASERLEDLCKDLEEELEEVKVKYDMYFLGVERMEPARRRENLKRNIARLKNAFTRNAGLRFRIEALHARYLSYERLWLRSAREKEEGTYRRDLVRARMKAARAGAAGRGGVGRGGTAALGRPGMEAEDVDLDDLAGAGPGEVPVAAAAPVAVAPDAPASRPSPSAAAPTAPPEAPPPRPAAPPPSAAPTAPANLPGAPPPAPALGEAQMRALYDAYLAAKKRCNEDTSRVSYDSVARSVNRQIPEIARAYKAREVQFKVVIKDGKAILKAVPKV